MSSNKTGITSPDVKSERGLGATLIGMLAAGFAGGTLLIAGAKLLGDKIEEKQIESYERLEGQRESDETIYID